ncbi:uracil-DNA glycosylase, partial [Klebsiella oxytoca]
MDTWESLRSECLACKGCSLADTRHSVVFGDGAEDAEILLI